MSESIWKDRAVEPPPITEELDVPLSMYMERRLWSLDGKERIRYKMPIRSNEPTREARHYIGRRPPGPEIKGDLVSPELEMEYPYIIADDKETLLTLLDIIMPQEKNKEKFLREVLVRATVGGGWVTPSGGYNSRDLFPEPGVTRAEVLPPWSWLLYKEDLDRLIEEDLYAITTALGYEPPINPP